MQTEIDALTAQCKNFGGLKLTYYITWKWLRADAVLAVGVAHARHRIKTHRRSTQPKKRNRCHATNHRHQNADAMVLAGVLMTGITPWTSTILNIIRGVNASHRRTGRTMASAF
jgi:hypothetical protein